MGSSKFEGPKTRKRAFARTLRVLLWVLSCGFPWNCGRSEVTRQEGNLKDSDARQFATLVPVQAPVSGNSDYQGTGKKCIDHGAYAQSIV